MISSNEKLLIKKKLQLKIASDQFSTKFVKNSFVQLIDKILIVVTSEVLLYKFGEQVSPPDVRLLRIGLHEFENYATKANIIRLGVSWGVDRDSCSTIRGHD